jgi:uncharacterized protein (TIGR02996 family)
MAESGFLHAIVESPSDDANRLIYADWLEDHGQKARADFIRLQVEFATLDVSDPSYPEKLARIRRGCGVLTGEVRAPWLTEVPGARVQLRRGMIQSVLLPGKTYLEHPPEAWAQVPVEFLWLQPSEGTGAALAQRSELARLPALSVDSWPAADLGDLLCSDHHQLAGLKTLRVASHRAQRNHPFFGRRGRKLSLPSLSSLYVSGGPQDWRTVLSGCRHPLRRIYVRGYSEFPDEDGYFDANMWDRLQRSKHWKTLEQARIWFHYNTVGSGHSEETDSFSDLPGAIAGGRRLEHLNISPYQASALRECPDWGHLKSLMIMQSLWSQTSELIRAPQVAQLESLWLGYWGFSERGQDRADWGPASPLANLRRLSVMCMASDQFPALLTGAYCTKLLRLDVAQYMEEANVKQLAKANLPELRHLTFGGYGDLPSFQPFLKSRAMPNLCTLVFTGGWGHFQKEQVEKAAQMLATTKTMPHLSLIGAGDRWWVLRDGQAFPVPDHIAPLECDWWDNAPG